MYPVQCSIPYIANRYKIMSNGKVLKDPHKHMLEYEYREKYK